MIAARIEFLPGVTEDIDRVIDHLLAHAVEGIADRIQDIISAIDVLGSNPMIGRPAHGDRRELVIGRHGRGYIALYVYVEEIDTVVVLELRSQTEAGYARE